MIWNMTTTTPEPKPALELSLQVDHHPQKLVLVGPSFQGWIYQTSKGPHCYRLLSQSEMKLARRHEIKAWEGKHLGPGLAPITKAWQPEELSDSYLVQYTVGKLDRTLAEALTDPEAGIRIDYAVKAVRALPVWWRVLWRPLLPMPADIAFAQTGEVFLLPLPKGPLPPVEQIFAAPERGLYLAPELARGAVAGDGGDWDRYALGVALLQCFAEISLPADAGAVLLEAARGNALSPPRVASNLPFWLERLAATRRALDQVRRLVSPDLAGRQAVNLEKLADRLQEWREQMNPLTAAREIRDAQGALPAFDLLQRVLLTQESYDLLVFAGQLAGQYLRRPLEGLDFFERAINQKPDRPEAYLEQFKTIAAGRHHDQLRLLIASDSPRKEQIDALLIRDFQKMSSELQENHELEMANYLLWRQYYRQAADFIHPRLYHGTTYLWWRFALNLAYAEALLGLGELEKACQLLQNIRERLEQAQINRTIDEADYLQHQHVLDKLMQRCRG